MRYLHRTNDERYVYDLTKIARAYVKARPGVERVKINGAHEVHAYGPMRNTNRIGWYLAGYVDDLAALAQAEDSPTFESRETGAARLNGEAS